jgi:hypothetical protein
MHHAFRWIPLICLGICSASTQPTPCVPEGESILLTFHRPDLLGTGFPVDAAWTPGPGSVIENDVVGSDDHMGPLTQRAGNTFVARFRNVNGQIVGPNGQDVTESHDGACAEVKPRWRYTFTGTIHYCERARRPGGPQHPNGCTEVETNLDATTSGDNPEVELCPC